MNNFHQLAQIINSINNSVTALSKTIYDTRVRVYALQQVAGLSKDDVSSLIQANNVELSIANVDNAVTLDEVKDLISKSTITLE